MDVTAFIVAQREKALLIGDYGSYRKQLSRRLLVVRRKLNYTSSTSKGRKYTTKPPITSDDIKKNHEFIHLLLLSSERAWAQAMQMKSLHSTDSGSKGITGSTRQHIGSRLYRATSYAKHLVELLKEDGFGATSQAILEARAYYVSLKGSSEFEKQNWENCLHEYSEARLIYATFGKSGNTKQNDIFRDLISSTVDPSLRYAAYQLKLPRTTSIDKIVARYLRRSGNEYVEQLSKSHPDALDGASAEKKKVSGENTQDLPQTITWRSRTVNLEDAATAQALAAVSAAEQKLSSFLSSNSDLDPRKKAAAYDDVLLPSQDAVDATKTAIDELTADGIPQGDRRMQSLQITRTAVNYDLVRWRVGRNRILCGDHDGAILEDRAPRKPKKPRKDGKEHRPQEESINRKLTRLRERVALYDATLQSLDSVKELPGVAADAKFLSELESKRAYFASLRCLSIAQSHALLTNTKAALALFSRALSLSTLIHPSPQPQTPSFNPPTLDILPHQTTTLRTHLQALVSRYRALADLTSLTHSNPNNPNTTNTNTLPLINRLNEYPPTGTADLKNLVTYPPKLLPVPVKPLFLDVAWNYVEYPGRKREEEAPRTAAVVNGVDMSGSSAGGGSSKEEKKEKKGWFGFGR